MRRILQALWRRSRFESEMAEEMRFHIEARAADIERGGYSPSEALRRARLEFGAPAGAEEDCREARGLRWWDELRQDLRYALRGLGRNRAFAAMSVATLALGIGTNAAIFTVVNAVLLKQLPVKAPEQLVEAYWLLPEGRPAFPTSMNGTERKEDGIRVADMFSYPHFASLREGVRESADLTGYALIGQVNVTGQGVTQLARGLAASWNYPRALGLEALLGRTFIPEDETGEGAESPILLHHSYWVAAFGADPGVLGRKLLVGPIPGVIVGVLPPAFHGVIPGETFDVLVTLPAGARVVRGDLRHEPRMWWIKLMARLHPGVTAAGLRSELETRLHSLLSAERIAEPYDAPSIRLVNGSRGLGWMRREFERPLRLVIFAAGLILLMAAINAGGLQLARSEMRTPETAARAALGASGSRVARQHLTESLVLSVLGLAAGLALAAGFVQYLPALLARHGEIPAVDLAPDLRFFAFVAVATLAVTLLSALYPAWRNARLDVMLALKHGSGGKAGRLPLGRMLTAVQAGLSLVLLAAAFLTFRTVSNLRSLDLGFSPNHVLVFSVSPAMAGYRDTRLLEFYERALQRLSALPGVRKASLARNALLQGGWSSSLFSYRDASGQLRMLPDNHVQVAAPGYFETVGIPLLAGRDFRAGDGPNAPKVVVINRKLARILRPNGDAGTDHTLYLGPEGKERLEVVGIVGDSKYENIRADAPPTVFAPAAQRPMPDGTFLLRVEGDPKALISSARATIAGIDPMIPVLAMRTQEEQVALAMERERILARLLIAFAVLALALAAVGVYGVLAYSMARRTAEIGLRLALGAIPGVLQRTLVLQAMAPVVVGLLAGLAGTYWFARLLQGFLFGVQPMDPLSLGAGAVLLGTAAALAAWIPARRATRIDPASALRCE